MRTTLSAHAHVKVSAAYLQLHSLVSPSHALFVEVWIVVIAFCARCVSLAVVAVAYLPLCKIVGTPCDS